MQQHCNRMPRSPQRTTHLSSSLQLGRSTWMKLLPSGDRCRSVQCQVCPLSLACSGQPCPVLFCPDITSTTALDFLCQACRDPNNIQAFTSGSDVEWTVGYRSSFASGFEIPYNFMLRCLLRLAGLSSALSRAIPFLVLSLLCGCIVITSWL